MGCWFALAWKQGCAIRKIEEGLEYFELVKGAKIYDFLVAKEQKLGARGHQALLEHFLV